MPNRPLRERGSEDRLHHAILADVPPTLRKINEKEPTPTGMYNITGFGVFVCDSNTMKVFEQFVYSRSEGYHCQCEIN
jgi:hypothetical protein